MVAKAPDGVVEGIEARDGSFVVGVQWHAEAMADRPEEQALFSGPGEGRAALRGRFAARQGRVSGSAPDWAVWRPSKPYTLGAEEEVMLLDPADWSLAYEIDRVLEQIPAELEDRVTRETQGAVLELATVPHADVAGVAAELLSMRQALARHLARARPEAGQRRHPPLHRLAGDRRVERRALPGGLRLDA